MNTQLLSVREQIQQDILTYASFVDDEKIFFNDEILDELCEIVVRNFEKLNWFLTLNSPTLTDYVPHTFPTSL